MFLKSLNMTCLAKRQQRIWQVASIKTEQALYFQALGRSFGASAEQMKRVTYDK